VLVPKTIPYKIRIYIVLSISYIVLEAFEVAAPRMKGFGDPIVSEFAAKAA